MRSREDIEHERLEKENRDAISRSLGMVSVEMLKVVLQSPEHCLPLSLQFWEGIRRYAVVMLEGLCQMQGRDLRDLHEHLAKTEKP